MKCIIRLCNINQGFISAILSILSLAVAIIAICISIHIMKKQNKISLLEQRYKVINEIEHYVLYELQSWEFDFSKTKIFYKYSKAYVETLFNKDFGDFLYRLEEVSKQINILQGDYDHAMRNGDCNDRNADDIDNEINSKRKEISKDFKKIKEDIALKYLKL